MRFGVVAGVLAWVACGGGGLEEAARPDLEEPGVEAPAAAVPGVPAVPPPASPPSAPIAPQFGPTQCSRTAYRQDGTLLLWETLGADGLVREHRAFSADGREDSGYVQQVEAGRVVVRDDYSRGERQQHREWRYDASGVLLRQERWQGAAPESQVVQYVYDPEGRLVQEDVSGGGVRNRTTSFYEEGRRVRTETREVEYSGALGQLTAWSTFTHHPNGQVKQSKVSWMVLGFTSWTAEDFDEAGRLRVSESFGDGWSSRIEQTHDASGRLVRRVARARTHHWEAEREEAFAYDEAGRRVLQRFADVYSLYGWEPVSGRESRRSEFGARGELVLQTVDVDEDGVADGRRTFSYDAAGRVLEQRLEGRTVMNGAEGQRVDSWIDDWARPQSPPGRVVYTYGCLDPG